MATRCRPRFRTDPLIYQGGSDGFLAPRESIVIASEDFGVDFEGEVAVIVGRRARRLHARGSGGGDPAHPPRQRRLAAQSDRRAKRPRDSASSSRSRRPPSRRSRRRQTSSATSVGRRQGEAAAARHPERQAVRPAGRRRRHGVRLSGADRPRGAGPDPSAPARSSARARCRTRGPTAGPAPPIDEGGAGYACIAELRTVETILEGKPETPYLKFGDVVRIEMKDAAGRSIFGAIEQASSATRREPARGARLRFALRRLLTSADDARGIFDP